MVDKVTDDLLFDSEGRFVEVHDKYEGCSFKESGELVAIFTNPVTLEEGQHMDACETDLAELIDSRIKMLTDTTKGYFSPQLAQDIADCIASDLHALHRLQVTKSNRNIPLDTRKIDPSEKTVWENFSYCANDEIYEP